MAIYINKLDQPNPEDPHGEQRRLALLKHNAQQAVEIMRASSDKDSVVLFLDIQNCTVSRQLAAALSGMTAQQVDEKAKEVGSSGTIPTAIFQIPRYRCYRLLQQVQRELHKQDKQDPNRSPIVERLNTTAKAGHFYCMAISRGKSLAELPLSGVESLFDDLPKQDIQLQAEELPNVRGGKVWFNIAGNRRLTDRPE